MLRLLVGVQGRNRGFGRDDRIGGPKNGDKRGMKPGGVGRRTVEWAWVWAGLRLRCLL